MSINREIDKEDVIHIYSRIFLRLKKEKKNVLFAEMWMDIEIVMQSEVSQKDKNKCRILTHICGI